MSDEPSVNLDALEREEARLRERLTKIAVVKELLRELAIPHSAPPQPQIQAMSAIPAPPAPDFVRAAVFDGTFGGLITCYRHHLRSPYHQLKHKVRLNYDLSLNRLMGEIGKDQIADWSADRVQKIYDENWAAGGKIAMGHGMVGKLRLLTSFGSVMLNDDACTRLSTILGNMRFPLSRGRSEVLTIEHVRAIRATAREHFGWDSIALAQALQLEFPKLRQVDIIGEWVPIGEPGTMSEIVRGDEKWVRGLRWSDIDENMILRRTLTSGRRNQQKEVKFNLKRAAMVIEEINRIPLEKRKGPMIICEYSNLPWSTAEFRRKWRIVATKAGVPASIKNKDAGRVQSEDEETELGAETAL